MIKVTAHIAIPEAELIFSYIRSPGPGGQNVNKVATTAQLRFNINSSSIPDNVRARLLTLFYNKISQEGDLIIKSSRHRTQQRNKQDALERLLTILRHAAHIPKQRKPTKPTWSSKQRRLSQKKLHSVNKAWRGRKLDHDE